MSKSRFGGIVGCALHVPREAQGASLEETLYTLGRRALADSRLSMEDIEGIVVASCDQLDGRAIAIMAASGSVGGVGRDIVSTPSSAEHAFVLGALRVASGQYHTQLVLSWSSTETADIADTQRLAADPYFNRHLPLDELSAQALQASALEAQIPGLREAALSIVAKNRRNGTVAHPEYAHGPTERVWIGAGNPVRWPLTDTMITRPQFGAVALVLVSEPFAAQRVLSSIAWIQGLGWATEPGLLGDRDLARLPSLAAAANQAYTQAGVKNPREEFDLAEVADATPYQEMLAYEGLGLSPRDEWCQSVTSGFFEKGGKLPVNPSGGALAFNPVFCSGLFRIAEAAQQLRGAAGAYQVSNPKAALAHASSGFAMQYNTVVALSADDAGGSR
jgi:acetyl-CoA C-acetyltransferase